jgi:RHS repeat-associated protein
MVMPQRSIISGSYRYGFNGKENDNDVKGSGNQQDYGMRVYDPRLGRFLSVDPLVQEYPWYSPYQFSGNSPILFIDRDGEEPERNKKSPGLPEIYGRIIALEITKNVTDRYISRQQKFWFSPVREPELKGRYVCGPGTGFISDTRQDKARLFNMFVGTNTQFYVDESNANDYKDFEAAVNSSIMKGFVTGTGPENYVFPRNGIISSKFLKSDVLKDALQKYLLKPSNEYGPKQSEFGINELGKDIWNNRTLFGSVTGLVGSAEISITPSNNGINIDIFNVTSITSGAFGKEFYKAIFGEIGERLLYPKSYVREPGATTEFGNVSQKFSLFIPFNAEGDKYGNIRKVINEGKYDDE